MRVQATYRHVFEVTRERHTSRTPSDATFIERWYAGRGDWPTAMTIHQAWMDYAGSEQ